MEHITYVSISQNLNSELLNFTCKINRVEKVTSQEFSGH